MYKIILLSVLIMFATTKIYSQEETGDTPPADSEQKEDVKVPYSPLSVYKWNYLIFGNSDDQVKAQLSLKYEFIRESGIFLGYSQSMFWMLYEKSSPFSEINFNPEVFWNYGDKIDFLQLGFYEHKSNGKDGLSSRAWDRSYAQFQTSTGRSFNAGIDIKVFYYLRKAEENRDIDDYTGYYEAKIFFRFMKPGPDSITFNEELYFRGGTGKGNYGFDCKKGWIEAGVKLRVPIQSIQPHFFIQGFYGYGESMVVYNKKDFAVRAGFVIK
ncbi:MAG TPA: phospholipase A [Spirochaetota bacterium]|nr:phospholipase A [Spirochaetota bacterium]